MKAMKTIITILAVIIIGLAAMLFVGGQTADAPTQTATSTNNGTTTTEVDPVDDGNYIINSEDSSITWRAQKPLISGYEDTGIIPVSEGEVVVSDQSITSGSITFDVANIEASQTSNTSAKVDRLTRHLRSDAFLDVEVYPTASFELTDATVVEDADNEYAITGDLTIKENTNEITFPATAGMDGGSLLIQGKTSIDRTEWGIRYGSDSFSDNLGDNVITDEVKIGIDIVATPTQPSTTSN